MLCGCRMTEGRLLGSFAAWRDHAQGKARHRRVAQQHFHFRERGQLAACLVNWQRVAVRRFVGVCPAADVSVLWFKGGDCLMNRERLWQGLVGKQCAGLPDLSGLACLTRCCLCVANFAVFWCSGRARGQSHRARTARRRHLLRAGLHAFRTCRGLRQEQRCLVVQQQRRCQVRRASQNS